MWQPFPYHLHGSQPIQDPNETNLDVLTLPLWGKPTYTPLQVDCSQFKNPAEVLEQQNTLIGSQPEPESDSDKDGPDQVSDVHFLLDKDNTDFNLLHGLSREPDIDGRPK